MRTRKAIQAKLAITQRELAAFNGSVWDSEFTDLHATIDALLWVLGETPRQRISRMFNKTSADSQPITNRR